MSRKYHARVGFHTYCALREPVMRYYDFQKFRSIDAAFARVVCLLLNLKARGLPRFRRKQKAHVEYKVPVHCMFRRNGFIRISRKCVAAFVQFLRTFRNGLVSA